MRTGPPRRLILASGSPRRKSLLAALGIPFRTVPTGFREISPRLPPEETARFLAWRKAEAVSRRFRAGRAVTADTVVSLDGKIYGKPRSRADARRQLGELSGRVHCVVTAVVVMDLASRCAMLGSERSRVTMRTITGSRISEYVATGEPMDKAGSYAIQGAGRGLIRKLEGDYFNVVGLPLRLLAALGSRFGIRVSASRLRRLYASSPF